MPENFKITSNSTYLRTTENNVNEVSNKDAILIQETVNNKNNIEDNLVEYTVNTGKETNETKSESDFLREKYIMVQNEYFKLQQELLKLEMQQNRIKSDIRNCKDSKRAANLQSQLSNIKSQIDTIKQNEAICESNMQNLNTQIINAFFEELNTGSNFKQELNIKNTSSSSIKEESNTNSSFKQDFKAGNTQVFYSNAPYSGKAIPQDLANKLDSKLGNGFSKKCEEVAAKLNCNANDLLAMMYSESGLNPNIKGKSGSVGLIQFMPSTLSANGYSSKQVESMSGVQQLDVVADILGKSKAMSGFSANDKINAGDLYAICFLPAAAKNDILCSSSGKLNWAYKANSGLDLNSDGTISKADLAARLNKKYSEMRSAI